MATNNNSHPEPKQLSKAEFVEYFTHLRKTNPNLTAKEFFDIVHNDRASALAASAAAASASASPSPPSSATLLATTTAPLSPATPPAAVTNQQLSGSTTITPSMVWGAAATTASASSSSPAAPPATSPSSSSSPAAAASSPSAPTIDITKLKEIMDRERDNLREQIHRQNLSQYQAFKQNAEEAARQRDDAEEAYLLRRRAEMGGNGGPLPPAVLPPMAAFEDARPPAAGAAPQPPAVPAAAAGVAPQRGIPEMIGEGLRFIGERDLFDVLLRYGLFALLISNGSWNMFFAIAGCLAAYSLITALLGQIKFRRGEAPQDDPAAAAAAPARQRRPQDCSTAFRVWYVCFKLFLLFFVSFLPWFKVEGLRRELHYEGVLRYPEDYLADEEAAAAAAPPVPPQQGNEEEQAREGPAAAPPQEEVVDEVVAAVGDQ